MVELVLTLFGRLSEHDETEYVRLGKGFSKVLRLLGDEIRRRLYEIARVHEILVENGWVAIGSAYDITYYKDLTLEEAKEELRRLGLEEYIMYLCDDSCSCATPDFYL
ncbi:hypothetical protein B6U99_02935 [Candidatus Geothermarchaeota archaeon ex4572_27]|nr:MAG: hypothetical protein B6U99_02935 [Candidatus Geothermarchaeota archaeon ex4572_27]